MLQVDYIFVNRLDLIIKDRCRRMREYIFDLLFCIAEVSFGLLAMNENRYIIVDSCSLNL